MKIVLPGTPLSQTRMKFSSRGGFGRIYDPRAKEKKRIKAEIEKYSGVHKLKNPVVSFIFHMPIPKSLRKADRIEAETGLKKHTKKPDVDNLVKLYLDCMTGIAFEGDEQVMLGPCVKLYHVEPKVIIILHESGDLLCPLEVDLLTAFCLLSQECGKYSLLKTVSTPDSCSQGVPAPEISHDMSCLRRNSGSCEQSLLAHDLPELAYLASRLPSHRAVLS